MNTTNDNFDFDIWANAVRAQLVAALEKKSLVTKTQRRKTAKNS